MLPHHMETLKFIDRGVDLFAAVKTTRWVDLATYRGSMLTDSARLGFQLNRFVIASKLNVGQLCF